MNTDRLIETLTDDLNRGVDVASASIARLFGAWMLALGVAVLVTAVGLGVRPDLPSAIGSPSVLLKFVASLTVATGAFWWVVGLARPDASKLARLAILPGVALFATLLWFDPPEELARSLASVVGSGDGLGCVVSIVAVSAAPLIVLLQTMRAGATTQPMLAGFGSGLLAGGAGACAYALHCSEDNAAFIFVWYSLAIFAVAVMGAVVGRRALVW